MYITQAANSEEMFPRLSISVPCSDSGSLPGCRIWFWIKDPTDDHTSQFNWARDSIYIPTLLVGAGGSTLMVTGLTYISSLVGKYYVCFNISKEHFSILKVSRTSFLPKGSSAFVFGWMLFTDRVANGVAMKLIQELKPAVE